MTRLPPLHAVRVFEAVARLGSFTGAAEELHLTQSAVSHQIRNLEEFFGLPLLDRRNRAPVLTPAGEPLFAAAQTALMVIAQASRQLQSQRNQIRIKSFPTIGARWLAPRLGDFYRCYPGTEVSLTTVWERDPSFRWDQYDFAIQYGNGEWHEPSCELLHEEWLTPVCSPTLWAVGQPAMQAGDLARMTLIHPTGDREDWSAWLRAAGLPRASGAGEQVVDTDYMAIEAALSGLGITVVDPLLVQADLAAGHLVEPLGLRVKSGKGYYLISPPGLLRDPRYQQFRDWLFAVMQAAETQARLSEGLGASPGGHPQIP